MVDKSQELAGGKEVPSHGRRDRRPRLGIYAAIVGVVLLGYIVPLLGFMVSIAVLVALLVMRRELWGAAVRPSALLVVLVWVGLWLPAISYRMTEWYWYLTAGEVPPDGCSFRFRLRRTSRFWLRLWRRPRCSLSD